MSFLDINDLVVEYETSDGPLRAVDGVSISVEEEEILGIVGESGCGKTTVTKAILGILAENGHVVDGTIEFRNREFTTLSEAEYRSIRWKEISYIIQNAMNALDPVHRIESQFIEVIRTHTSTTKEEARERTHDLLTSVGIDPNRMRDYPHELSGGQRQRVVIALALALDPPLVIADEPTTGLDVVIQNEILELIRNLQSGLGNSMIIITHDISVVAEIADRVAVMYGGEIVELGTTREVFKESAHPYTMGLMNAFPSIEGGSDELVSIPGSPPNLVNPPDGCRFADRCPFATTECIETPPPEEVSPNHATKCHYPNRIEEFRAESRHSKTWETTEQ
jgi:oligopeptide/dipeptide ABC transporter ATP-binding protein